MDALQIHPVGCVRRDQDEFPEGECVLEIRPELEPALLGIEPGRRLQVMWWMHEMGDDWRSILQCHPRGDRSRPRRGVFALRSPMRPNPIGSTVVTVKGIDGSRVVVSGLDAFDGSPIVDIKWA